MGGGGERIFDDSVPPDRWTCCSGIPMSGGPLSASSNGSGVDWNAGEVGKVHPPILNFSLSELSSPLDRSDMISELIALFWAAREVELAVVVESDKVLGSTEWRAREDVRLCGVDDIEFAG